MFLPAQLTALEWLAAHRAALSADHLTLWDFHEPSWREYKSSQWYVDRLRHEGFDVEQGSAGMPTAFCAISWGRARSRSSSKSQTRLRVSRLLVTNQSLRVTDPLQMTRRGVPP